MRAFISNLFKAFAATSLVVLVSACGGGGGDDKKIAGLELPYGNYGSNLYLLQFSKSGTFSISHSPGSYDSRTYRTDGTFDHTVDVLDAENNSYGKLLLTVNTITIGSSSASSITDPFCDFASSCNLVVRTGDKMEGWWAYSKNITSGGSYRVYLNAPGVRRGDHYYDGHKVLLSLDPR
jgi:hypothetical protein